MLILKASSSTSHVLFMLRCSPCHGNAILSQIDTVLKSNISHIANVVLSNVQWIQTSLPVKAGGLGIHRAASLASPAYLASATSTASLQDLILIRSLAAADKYYILYRSNWSSAYKPIISIGCYVQHANNVLGTSLLSKMTLIISSQQHLNEINLDFLR